MKRIILLALTLIIMVSCQMPWIYGFCLKNSSQHWIRCELCLSYPDVALSNEDKHADGGRDFAPNSYPSLYVGETGLPSEQAVVHWLNPNDTISVIIIHLDTLRQYPWETIRDEYKVLARYDLSADDIHSMTEMHYGKYVIPFPPTPEMEHMHIYPSYKELVAQYGHCF